MFVFKTPKPAEVTSPLGKRIGRFIELRPMTDDKEPLAYLVDFATHDPGDTSWYQEAKNRRKPVVLLNIPEGVSVAGCTVTVPTRAAIAFYEDDYTITRILDAPIELTSSKIASFTNDRQARTYSEISEAEQLKQPVRYGLTDDELANKILDGVSPEKISALRAAMSGYAAANGHDVRELPMPMYSLQYTYIDQTSTIEESTNWVTKVVFEFALVASYNAAGSQKYLRIAALKSEGNITTNYSVGALHWNSDKNRGYFMNTVKYQVSSPDPQLTVCTAAPKAYQTGDITSTYKWTIGVDTSVFIRYDSSYDVGRTVSFSGSGFLCNYSADTKTMAAYNNLAMTNSNRFDIFDSGFFRTDDVKGIPALAVNGYGPLFDVIYQAPYAFNSSTTFTVITYLEILHAWVTGNIFSFDDHLHWYYFNWLQSPYTVDFSAVKVTG